MELKVYPNKQFVDSNALATAVYFGILKKGGGLIATFYVVLDILRVFVFIFPANKLIDFVKHNC